MKSVWAERSREVQIKSSQAAMWINLGAFAGAGDDAVVLKTDLCWDGVDKHGVHYTGVGDVFRRNLKIKSVLSGLQPVMWISIGALSFLDLRTPRKQSLFWLSLNYEKEMSANKLSFCGSVSKWVL
jgi:hypothetical protein